MVIVELIFWVSAACILYAYIGYPLIIGVVSRLRGRPLRCVETPPASFSIVVAAYNESAGIACRVRELLTLLEPWNSDCELVVVCDGSSDGTLERAIEAASNCGNRFKFVPVRLASNQGKAAALNAGVAAASRPIVVFADARQTWAGHTLANLLAPFGDPDVGAVSGDLVLHESNGALAGVGLYWKIEKWLRVHESAIHSTIGATGAISAVRRELFAPLKPGTILDDVSWPAAVALAGRRVIHEPKAQAFDRLPERTRDEFRRKVRTLSGNFQLLFMHPEMLRLRRNPIAFGFVSKKLMRLAVPWAMLAALGCNVAIVAAGPRDRHVAYGVMLGLQLAGYLLGVAGLCWARLAGNRLAGAASSLLVLNAAAFCAFWSWVAGRGRQSWHKTAYHVSGQPAPGGATSPSATSVSTGA